jgi:hypothetical protein
MFSLFSNKKKNSQKESIFIHIPKSGGSTFVGLLKDSIKDHQLNRNTPTHKIEKIGLVSIKHIDFLDKERKFKGKNIFRQSTNDVLKDKKIFLLVRNPIDRLVSEFNFQYHILDGKNGNKQAAIITNLKRQPKNFEDYIKCNETHNYQLKFLLGRPLNDSKKVTENNFKSIIKQIEDLPIYCGVTDEYASFLNMFENKTNIKLVKKVLVRKKTPFLYHTEITDSIKDKIIELNNYDYQLYNYIKNNISLNNIKFKFIEKDQFIV